MARRNDRYKELSSFGFDELGNVYVIGEFDEKKGTRVTKLAVDGKIVEEDKNRRGDEASLLIKLLHAWHVGYGIWDIKR